MRALWKQIERTVSLQWWRCFLSESLFVCFLVHSLLAFLDPHACIYVCEYGQFFPPQSADQLEEGTLIQGEGPGWW